MTDFDPKGHVKALLDTIENLDSDFQVAMKAHDFKSAKSIVNKTTRLLAEVLEPDYHEPFALVINRDQLSTMQKDELEYHETMWDTYDDVMRLLVD